MELSHHLCSYPPLRQACAVTGKTSFEVGVMHSPLAVCQRNHLKSSYNPKTFSVCMFEKDGERGSSEGLQRVAGNNILRALS